MVGIDKHAGSSEVNAGADLVSRGAQDDEHIVEARSARLRHNHLEERPSVDQQELLGAPHPPRRPRGQDYSGRTHQASTGLR
jgi:hypothetical protein